MIKKSSSSNCCCAICDNSNRASICTVCVNYRLNDYSSLLKPLKSRRDHLYSKLNEVLVAKGKADEQLSWKVLQHEKLANLREKLRHRKEQLALGKDRIKKTTADLNDKYRKLELSREALERYRVEQLEKNFRNLVVAQKLRHMAFNSQLLHKQSAVISEICNLFPQCKVISEGGRNDGFNGQYDVICNVRLPRGLDPHSVPSEELSVSLGYMVQLLNLVVKSLAAPALYNSGFAGSCSLIWQRYSYWHAGPASRSNEYPLFIPRHLYCSTSGDENSFTERSSSNFGVASMESEKKGHLGSSRSSSFNYSSASPHSIETHKELQKGISLLKKSVACVTAYGFNSLGLDVPTKATTFEAFAKLLAILSSSKEARSISSMNMACSRSSKQVQKLNKSVWNANSTISSSTLLESGYALHNSKNRSGYNLPNSTTSFLFADADKNEGLIDEWDLVEHAKFPPPPSDTEDVEHWTRAMFIDATKK